VMNDAKSRGIVVGVVVGAADCGEARRQGVQVSCECPTPKVRLRAINLFMLYRTHETHLKRRSYI
jgi:hypothetical protein